MPSFGMLQDTFDDNARDPALWSASYGDIVETGGRARVPCTTDYSAYASAAAYTLAEAQVACRVYAAAAGGAAVEALAEVLVLSSTGGTDAGFSLNTVTGQLKLISRTGYADPGEVALTYDATAHAWLRLRETAGSLSWDTSPNGQAWTTRRTAASPAWVGNTDLKVILAGHRDSGVGNYCEFDNLNITRPGRIGGTTRTGAGLAYLARTGAVLSGG